MKTAFITGVGRGIGKALAQEFLKNDWTVVGTSQSGNVDYSDKNLRIFQLDLASVDSIKKCVESVASSHIKIDAQVNNAGVMLDPNETRLNPNELRQTLEVNVIGTADLTEKLIPLISNGGHIVNISSQAGSITDMDDLNDSHSPYYYPAYKISKAALNMYTRTLAARLKHEGTDIVVSSVHPGWVKTDMGGEEAPMSPEEAAAYIFKLASSHPETGQFWFKGEKFPW